MMILKQIVQGLDFDYTLKIILTFEKWGVFA
jgi:hypothetical protein